MDKAYTLSGFVLWNDVNVGAEGIAQFRLNFWGANGESLGETSVFNVGAGQYNAGTFNFRPVADVTRVTLQVIASHAITGATYANRIEVREVGFIGVADKPEIVVNSEIQGALGVTLSGRVLWEPGSAYENLRASLGDGTLNLFDHALKFIATPAATWEQALLQAQQQLGAGWHPATITSAEEQDLVARLLDENGVTGDVYLGAYIAQGDANTAYAAHWINGEQWAFTRWGITNGATEPFEPSKNHYLTMRGGPNGWSWQAVNPASGQAAIQGILMERTAPAVSLITVENTTEFQLFIPYEFISSGKLQLTFTDTFDRARIITHNLKPLKAAPIRLDRPITLFSDDNFGLSGELGSNFNGLTLLANNEPLAVHEYRIVNQPLVDINRLVLPAGWHLATITSPAEHAYLAQLLTAGQEANQVVLGRNDRYYIGGSRVDGVWSWGTQEPFNYENWAPREPSGDGLSLVLSGRQGWMWNDLPGLDGNSNGYILERSPGLPNVPEGTFNLLVPATNLTPGLNEVILQTQDSAGRPVEARVYLTLAPG